jgi:uncharacterized protein YjiS (DUF1127 family)
VLEAGQDFVFHQARSAWIQALGVPTLIALEDHEAAGQRREPLATRLWHGLVRRLAVARTRAQLRAMSDRTLADIGVRRTEIDCLVR